MNTRDISWGDPRKGVRSHCSIAERRLRVACVFAISLGCLIGRPLPCPAQSTAEARTQDATSDIIAALRSRNFDEALQRSGAAIKKTPGDYRLWALRGMAFAGKGTPPAALAAYQHALKLAPTYLPALEGAAQIEYQEGSDHARPLLLRVLAQLPGDPTTHAMLAALDYKAQRCEEAVPHFRQAGSLLENQPPLLNEFASCLGALDRYEEAIPLLQRILALDPARQNTRYNLALAQWSAGRTQDAVGTLGPLIEANPRDEDVLTLAADVYEANNDTPRAVQLLRQAIVANPQKVTAYLQFSTLSYNHGSLQVGIDMLNTGLSQLPDEPRLYLARAILKTEKGDFPEAMKDFETADHLDPNLSFAGVAEGLARSEQHRSKEALATFRVAAKAHPKDAFTQYLLAEALSEQNATRGTPEDAEAIEAAKHAVALDPRMSDALNLLSALSLRDGHPEQAIDYSQRALAFNPDDQQALYHLMLALRKADRKDEVPAVLKRFTAARKAQSLVQKKRYKLDEVPQQPLSVSEP
jgi:tetratricopeptide (TPR) repeat protein